MSTDRPRTPLPELAAAVATGLALVLLALAVLVAMHVLTGRLLPEDGAQGEPTSEAAVRVPSREIDQVRVPGAAGAAGTMGA